MIPFFEFPEEIRKIVYTTNALESLHMTLRKVTKTSYGLNQKIHECFAWLGVYIVLFSNLLPDYFAS